MAVKVSVVIPSRNRWHLLQRTLRSALSQVDIDVEVVVVDDGSSDGTPAGLAAWNDPRLRVVRNATGRGVAAARNRGIAHAEGSLIAFLDDDDLWSPRKLASQVHALREGGATWTYTDAIVVDDSLHPLAIERAPTPDAMPEHLRRFNAVPGGCSGVLALTDTVRETGGFDESLRILADWDLWLRLQASGGCAHTPDLHVAYVRHAGNMTHRALDGAWEELAHLEAKLGDGVCPDGRWFSRWLAGAYGRAGQRGAATRAYLRGALRYRLAGNIIRAGGGLVRDRRLAVQSSQGRTGSLAEPDWLSTLRKSDSDVP